MTQITMQPPTEAGDQTGDLAKSEEPPSSRARLARRFRAILPGRAPAPTPSPAPQPTDAQAPALAEASTGLSNLRNLRVQDVAVPRAEIIAVASTIGRDELVATFRESGLTRLPVYDGTLDTPIGFVNLKDVALKHGFGEGGAFDLSSLIRELLYVPPSMPLSVLLPKMQAVRIHMALVIDEYGGTDGLVTIEDLLEQVVGEIEDEHDQDDDIFFQKSGDGSYIALAKTPLEEFEEEIGIKLTDHEEIDAEEIDTLGGLVFMLAGRVPARGEVIMHPSEVEFEVVEAEPRRIKRLRVRHAAGEL